MKGNYLITTDEWFYAPDGKLYRAVWGNVQIVTDDILGIKTNARSSNWFAKVGSEDNHLIIAGCQIHYSCRCDEPPTAKYTEDFAVVDGEVKEFQRPTSIYIAR